MNGWKKYLPFGNLIQKFTYDVNLAGWDFSGLKSLSRSLLDPKNITTNITHRIGFPLSSQGSTAGPIRYNLRRSDLRPKCFANTFKSPISSIYLYFSEGFLTSIPISPKVYSNDNPYSSAFVYQTPWWFFSEHSPSFLKEMWWANIHPCFRENFDKVTQSPFPNSRSKQIDRWMNNSKLFQTTVSTVDLHDLIRVFFQK